MPTIALLSSVADMRHLHQAFQEEFPEARLRMGDDLGALCEIDAAVCWRPPPGLLARMPNLALIQSAAAGIDHLTSDPTLPDVPVFRIIDPAMAFGMASYVCWAVVHRQRAMADYLAHAQAHVWKPRRLEPPQQHGVGIAGLGTLGLACAQALMALGYRVRGWSRTPRSAPAGLQAFHGDAQRDQFLSGCDTLVCLLPLTPETMGILSRDLFERLPRGAHLVNVGRGAHLVEADLLSALDDGLLRAATLDTFVEEPLPPAHPFWHDPRITVTPHIATATSPVVIARQTRLNLERLRQGNAQAAAVDLKRGY
jgi:glyoxylate/hydroxypyruvate reductase